MLTGVRAARESTSNSGNDGKGKHVQSLLPQSTTQGSSIDGKECHLVNQVTAPPGGSAIPAEPWTKFIKREDCQQDRYPVSFDANASASQPGVKERCGSCTRHKDSEQQRHSLHYFNNGGVTI